MTERIKKIYKPLIAIFLVFSLLFYFRDLLWIHMFEPVVRHTVNFYLLLTALPELVFWYSFAGLSLFVFFVRILSLSSRQRQWLLSGRSKKIRKNTIAILMKESIQHRTYKWQLADYFGKLLLQAYGYSQFSRKALNRLLHDKIPPEVSGYIQKAYYPQSFPQKDIKGVSREQIQKDISSIEQYISAILEEGHEHKSIANSL